MFQLVSLIIQDYRHCKFNKIMFCIRVCRKILKNKCLYFKCYTNTDNLGKIAIEYDDGK